VQAKEEKMLRKEQNELNRVFYPRKNKGEKNSNQEQNSRTKHRRAVEGKERHTDWKRCPAIKAACNKCRKIGHWEKMCKTKKIRRGQRPIFLGTICELLKTVKNLHCVCKRIR